MKANSDWKGFSGRAVPVDDGPLSIKIEINGRTIGGFDLSASSYMIPVAADASPKVTKVIPADRTARYEILSRAHEVPVQAVVKSSSGPS